MTTIVWFRQDLRRHDNPALTAAAARGDVIPLFILDEETPAQWRPGAASRWWLHHSLTALRRDLGALTLRRGAPQQILPALVRESGASAVYWNRCYEPHSVARDKEMKASLRNLGIEVVSFPGNLLHEPWEITTGAGGAFKVFTPFWRASLTRQTRPPLQGPSVKLPETTMPGDRLDDWRLLPAHPDWAAGWDELWTPGESGALARLDAFIRDGLEHYADRRDRPDLQGTSRLSPHLRWGEISPRQIGRGIAIAEQTPSKGRGAEKFLAELGWREFSHHLLYHFPDLPHQNWRREFDAYPWRDSPDDLAAWQRARTGYPLVDAGMRELWQTGWMHNRARMIVASFLVKHLRVDWRRGEAWFWDTLVDADLANNAAGWQWVAGSGADASPYFRVFNPIAQGTKFDPDGDYVRRWCPELVRLPNDFIHAPFNAPPQVLADAGIRVGETYPAPIVEHHRARTAALEGYRKVRSGRAATKFS